MVRLEERIWEPDFAGLTRRDRRACRYSVYLPDPLAIRRFSFDGDVAADVADAEADLVKRLAALEVEEPPDPAQLSKELEAADEPGGLH